MLQSVTPTIFSFLANGIDTSFQDNFFIRDSLLTAQGHTQCAHLRNTFPHHSDISIILASPLRRAIQTAIESFSPALVRPEVKLLLVPAAQEISAKPCDIGHEREDLEREMRMVLSKEGEEGFNVEKIDYSIVEDGWSRKVCSRSQFQIRTEEMLICVL
jgi:hypothetical protein